jgi:hypothetical protein
VALVVAGLVAAAVAAATVALLIGFAVTSTGPDQTQARADKWIPKIGQLRLQVTFYKLADQVQRGIGD